MLQIKREIQRLAPTWFPKPPSERVRKILESKRAVTYSDVDLVKFLRTSLPNEAWIDSDTIRKSFRGDVQQIIDNLFSDPQCSSVTINAKSEGGTAWNITGLLQEESAKSIVMRSFSSAAISGGIFDTITVSDSDASVVLENVFVRRLRFVNSGPGRHTANVKIIDSWIGRLDFTRKSVRDFTFLRGGVLQITCENPTSENPFSGSVLFLDVFLPRDRKTFPEVEVQVYRNMRYHLTQLQNGPAAAVFHAAELALERHEERGLNRGFNFLYEEFSNYGLSPALPLVWLGLLWVATTTLLVVTGVDVDTTAEGVGWQDSLLRLDWLGEILRAVIVGFQPISWLGALISPGHSVSMAPNCFWVQIWLVIDGILSTVLLALFIFALRRRFRLAA